MDNVSSDVVVKDVSIKDTSSATTENTNSDVSQTTDNSKEAQGESLAKITDTMRNQKTSSNETLPQTGDNNVLSGVMVTFASSLLLAVISMRLIFKSLRW